MPGRRPSHPLPLIPGLVLGFLVVHLSGCFVMGGVIGSSMAEPEMKSELRPFPLDVEVTVRFVDQSYRLVRYAGTDEMSDEEYLVRVERRKLLSTELSTMPNVGELITLACERDDADGEGRFAGFVGYRMLRLMLALPSGERVECPIGGIEATRKGDELAVPRMTYERWGRAHLLPSRTVVLIDGGDGIERIPADEIRAINLPVRGKRVIYGSLIGLGVDIMSIIILRILCGREGCFGGSFS